MRIVFFGTPQEAVPLLELCRQQGDVVAVVTAPDRPRGRGRKVRPSPVKEAAVEAGLEVLQPGSCGEESFVRRLRELGPDVVVVVAYGQILPRQVLGIPRLAVNVHFSILPQLRGAAPVQRAVEWGFRVTGVTVQKMAAELDAGPVLCQRLVPIHLTDDAPAVEQRIVAAGVECLGRVLEDFAAGRPLEWQEQSGGLATWAPKIQGGEGAVDLHEPAKLVAAKIRGLAGSGGAYCLLAGKRLKLWTAVGIWRSELGAPPGTVEAVVEAGPLISCGGEYLLVTEAQLEGKRRMSGPELVRGRILEAGKKLEAAPGPGR